MLGLASKAQHDKWFEAIRSFVCLQQYVQRCVWHSVDSSAAVAMAIVSSCGDTHVNADGNPNAVKIVVALPNKQRHFSTGGPPSTPSPGARIKQRTFSKGGPPPTPPSGAGDTQRTFSKGGPPPVQYMSCVCTFSVLCLSASLSTYV